MMKTASFSLELLSIFYKIHVSFFSRIRLFKKKSPCNAEDAGDSTWVRSLCQEDPLEEEMATHSSILAGKSNGQRSLEGCSLWGHQRAGYNLMTKKQQQHKTKIIINCIMDKY